MSFIDTFKGQVAPVFIGLFSSSILYGVSLLQIYYYYRTYTKDRVTIKFLVAALLLLDTAALSMNFQGLYTQVIVDFGNVEKLSQYPLIYGIENGVLTLIVFTVQLFYIGQMAHVVSNTLVLWSVAFSGTCSFGLGIYMTVLLCRTRTVDSLAEPLFQLVSSLVQGFAAISDILIAVVMCCFLSSNRSGFHRMETIVDRLIATVVSRGILTAVFQVSFLVMVVAFRGKTYWHPIHQVLGKLYINSALMSLNMRKGLNSVPQPVPTLNLPDYSIPSTRRSSFSSEITLSVSSTPDPLIILSTKELSWKDLSMSSYTSTV